MPDWLIGLLAWLVFPFAAIGVRVVLVEVRAWRRQRVREAA